jgi:hypothetical protein
MVHCCQLRKSDRSPVLESTLAGQVGVRPFSTEIGGKLTSGGLVDYGTFSLMALDVRPMNRIMTQGDDATDRRETRKRSAW